MDTTEKKPPPRAASPVARAELALVFSAGEVVTPPRRYRPGPAGLLIGRDAAGGLALPTDPRASRKHASVREGPSDALRLVDEGSSNGTWVNGARVAEADLAEGDVVTVGDSLLVASVGPEGVDDAALPELVGTSSAVRRLRAQLARAAPGDAAILLLGEAGCGKEIAARALHALSGRRGAFVAVACGAAAEGQLFGLASGAFAGEPARPGLYGAAEGGTLFLDELADLAAALLPKLLCALRDRAVSPVGAGAPRPCDVRVIAATNRDLAAAAAGRGFPAELYARLAAAPLYLPPLRRRREDVLALVAHALGTPSPKLEVELAERLLLYDWPYNVRELRSLAKQLRIRSGEGPYELDPVEGQLTPRPGRVAPTRPAGAAANAPTPREGFAAARTLVARAARAAPAARPPGPREAVTRAPTLRDVFAAGPPAPPPAPVVAERDEAHGPVSSARGREPPPDRAQLETLLRRHAGVVSEVARAMSRSRKQVYRWLEHHGLEAEAFRR